MVAQDGGLRTRPLGGKVGRLRFKDGMALLVCAVEVLFCAGSYPYRGRAKGHGNVA